MSQRKPRSCTYRNERLAREDAALLAELKKEGVHDLPYKRVLFTARSGRRIVRTATGDRQFNRLMKRRGARQP